jgi:hypothetical protein
LVSRVFKNIFIIGWAWWLMQGIPTTQEVKIGRIAVQGQPGENKRC